VYIKIKHISLTGVVDPDRILAYLEDRIRIRNSISDPALDINYALKEITDFKRLPVDLLIQNLDDLHFRLGQRIL
jgi:hypothetical protein